MSLSDFSSHLITGEKLVWTGRPAQGLLFYGQDAFVIPFSLLWAGGVTFGFIHAWSQPESMFPGKFISAFLLVVGIQFVFGRFIVDAWIRRQTIYAVTNKRVLINRLGLFPKFVALSLDNLPTASVTSRSNGRGDIVFAGSEKTSGRNRSMVRALDTTPQFIGIDNVRDVFKKIQVAAHKPA